MSSGLGAEIKQMDGLNYPFRGKFSRRQRWALLVAWVELRRMANACAVAGQIIRARGFARVCREMIDNFTDDNRTHREYAKSTPIPERLREAQRTIGERQDVMRQDVRDILGALDLVDEGWGPHETVQRIILPALRAGIRAPGADCLR